jgi:hypothetical protein
VEDDLPELQAFRESESPEVQAWVRRPLAFEAQLALGGPLGFAGGAVDFSPSPGFSLNAGAGVGESTRTIQAALMSRLRLVPVRGFGVGAEGGVATGSYSENLDCDHERCPIEWRWDTAVWGITGLFLERRFESGLTLRWSFGAGSVLNVPDAKCERCVSTDEPGVLSTTVPYALISAGYAFELGLP